MAVLKCKMCGAGLNINENADTVTCRYCESVQTIPKIDDEAKLKLYERATTLRLSCDFDGASSVFQNIIAQYPEEAESYWGACLCKYGIEYVDDPATFLKIPTCHRTRQTSIFSDHDYLNALKYAGTAGWKYEEEAAQIDHLQQKILEISRVEQPYDIFICYKETDDMTGLRTEDSLNAQDIYTELIKNGYRVFYSRITLRGKAGSEYEPYIYSALSTAKVMLIIGSKKEYFEAVWLKNEWSRYLDMTANSNKTIIPCFEKITADELPPRLRSFQGLDMSNKIFFSDLMQNIQRICSKTPPSVSQPVTAARPATDIQRKEFDYSDGAYSGGAVGTKPHGYGIRYYNNGDRYEGEWHMGVMQGKGTFYYADGNSWQGIWKNNSPENGNGTYRGKDFELIGTIENCALVGEGKHYINGKLVKKGFFKDGRLDGQGTFFNNDGLPCMGEFRNGLPYNAKGVYPIKAFSGKDATYKGSWSEGKASGQGTIVTTDGKTTAEGFFTNGFNATIKAVFPNGRTFEGEMLDGNITGKGKLFSPEGTLIYDGYFKDMQYHGKCVHYFENGEKFEGTYNNGFKSEGIEYAADGSVIFEGKYTDQGKYYEGVGKIRNKDGSYYEGTAKNGQLNGRCRYYDAKGVLCNEGIYENNKLVKGTVYYANGDKYAGSIKDSLPHGQGTYTYNQPKWKGVWQGEWNKGVRVTGKGLIVHVNEDGAYTGKFYDGFLKDGKACGNGLLVLADGTRYEGEFFNDRIYNGTYYSARNTVIDTYTRGQSNNQRNQDIAFGILKGLSGL